MFPDDDKTDLYPVDERPTIIFMHENAGNLGLRIPQYKHYIENLEVNILSMAYRGYSYSEKAHINEAGLKRDADSILAWLEHQINNVTDSKINPQLVYLQGRSLGGGVAAYMASKKEHLFRGLILENTFMSIDKMAGVLYPFLRPFIPLICNIHWANDKIVPELRLPIMYVTGDDDEIVPFQQTLDLHTISTKAAFTELLVVKDGGHNDSWTGRNYITRLQIFIEKCVTHFQLEDYDEWADGKKHDKKKKPLKQESKEAEKVKIKTTVMPPGSLKNMKKRANEAKNKPRDATEGEFAGMGGSDVDEQEYQESTDDESHKEDL